MIDSDERDTHRLHRIEVCLGSRLRWLCHRRVPRRGKDGALRIPLRENDLIKIAGKCETPDLAVTLAFLR